jgi:H+/Cl- antiporter ClcA
MGKLILKSQDLKNGVGSYCDEGDLLALLIAHGLVERAEKPATGGKVWPTTDDEVAETSRAAQAAQMGKDTQVRTQAGINAKPAAESMPQRRRLASLSVLENTATPSRESQAAESQGAHEGELGKSPKSRRRSIHVIPDFIQKLNRRFSIQVDSDSEYSDSETEDMDAPQPLPNRTGMLHMLNEKRKNFMGHKDHSDDKNHISPLSAVRSRFSKIEKKHSHETHQYLEQYSKRVKHRRASVIKSENVRRTIPAWVACIAVGLLVGVADAAMLHSITELFTIKTKLLQWTTDHHDPVAAFGFVLALCLPLTMIAAAMVVYVAPKAAGSGLAEVKAMLNGSRSKGLLTFTTAFVKIVGIVFTIIGGLALGREGPMVHVGAAMANFILHVPYFHRRIIGVHATRRAQAVFNIRSEYLNHYVIMGGAAGVAAAFNAPITGVLYMLEEMASHWPTWLTVQVFVSTGFAALTMQCIKNSLYGIGDETSAFLVNDHSIIARDWKSGDMPIFMLIGIVGGLASTVLSICCKKMFMLRRRITSRLGNGYSFFEVAVITLLAVATYVFLPLAFECEASEVSHSYHGGDDASDHGTNHSYSGDSHGDGHLRRFLSAGGEAGFVRYRCDDHYHNQMASLAHWNPEHAIVMLWSSDMKFDTMVLLVYLVVYMVQFMLLPGTKIPIGTFAPNMLMGSLLGRFIGEYCGSGYSDPAIFAQVGAAAMLSGYTHM